MNVFYYLLMPFTWLLSIFNYIFNNYGLALILFALVVKVILFPLSLKGKRGMIQMTMLQGKITAIQKKYANDRVRQNEEIQKLYQKEKVNPMGGCLWSMVPLLILLPLYAIIREPMMYIMGLAGDQITTLMTYLKENFMQGANINIAYEQLQGAAALYNNFDAVTASPVVADFAGQLQAINLNFLGLDLSTIPVLKFWENGVSWNSVGLFLIPIVSALTGLGFSFYSMKTNAMNNPSQQANKSGRSMLIIGPLMSLWIGFAMPGILGIYWIANNVFSWVQEIVAGKLLKKDYEAAAKAREEQERQAKEEEKKKRREAAERKAQAIAEGKKKKQQPKKKDSAVIGVSGVGTRAYARGRAYDPYRFSPDGPTAYKVPGEEVDEAAVEAALEKKGRKAQDVEEEVTAALETPETETQAAPEAPETPETDAAQTVDAAVAAVDQEIEQMQSADDAADEPKA